MKTISVKCLFFLMSIVMISCGQERPTESNSTTLLHDSQSCREFLKTDLSVSKWLSSLNQSQLEKAFRCQPDSSYVPTGFGKGTGSLVAKKSVWNSIQKSLGSALWGGKRIYMKEKKYELLNQMNSSKTERYRASLYIAPSSFDKRPSVVLDYRIDDSVRTLGAPQGFSQRLVDRIIHEVRDEVRELHLNGKPTKVFIGRAYLSKTSQKLRTGENRFQGDEYHDSKNWTFVANFFLDFRKPVKRDEKASHQ